MYMHVSGKLLSIWKIGCPLQDEGMTQDDAKVLVWITKGSVANN